MLCLWRTARNFACTYLGVVWEKWKGEGWCLLRFFLLLYFILWSKVESGVLSGREIMFIFSSVQKCANQLCRTDLRYYGNLKVYWKHELTNAIQLGILLQTIKAPPKSNSNFKEDFVKITCLILTFLLNSNDELFLLERWRINCIFTENFFYRYWKFQLQPVFS